MLCFKIRWFHRQTCTESWWWRKQLFSKSQTWFWPNLWFLRCISKTLKRFQNPCWPHPRESGPEVDQAPGGVITSPTWCCNLSGGVALIVWFTTNGMCAKNNNIYAWREQAIIRDIATHDLCCCLLPQCEALRTCRSGFPIATLDWSRLGSAAAQLSEAAGNMEVFRVLGVLHLRPSPEETRV